MPEFLLSVSKNAPTFFFWGVFYFLSVLAIVDKASPNLYHYFCNPNSGCTISTATFTQTATN
ncbi:MAG: hypothetical protein D6768_00785 [Chloroflexi bacterium]|nr:MAG: hypothetical protein D6768_00785 [Chloroflexota bacterium]